MMALFSRIASLPMALIATSSPIPRPASGPLPRFAGDPAWWVSATPPLNSLAAATVRFFAGSTNGIPGSAATPWSLFEVAPIPSFGANVFQEIRFGLPVLYLLVPSVFSSSSEQFVQSGEIVISAALAQAFFAVCFQDRISRDPAAWSAEIARALTQSGTAAGTWTTFTSDLAGIAPLTVRILDHTGRPMSSGSFTIGGGPAVTPVDGNSGVAAGPATAVSFTSAIHPIVAGAEQEGGQLDAPYPLAPGERHVHVLDADAWFAPKPASSALERWRGDSHVEPIVDGTPYFRRLVPDLRSAKGTGGAYLAGWAFKKESLLDRDRNWPLVPGDDTTELAALIREVDGSGAEVRMLVNTFLKLEVATIDDVQLIPILFAVYAAMMPLTTFTSLTTDAAGFGLLLAGIAAASVVLTSASMTQSILQGIAEISKSLVETLPNGIAFPALNPVRFHDNPMIAGPLNIGITIDDITHVGVYHQKLVVVRPTAGGLVGYLGGIDLNSDRIDTPLHRALFPFHDVQLRITGDAAIDMSKTFEERLSHEGGSMMPTPPPASGAGNHLVQIARTYFAPRPGSGTSGLPFAPGGEKLIHDTLLKAIDSARDFIYIEDQYFTPDAEYVDHLLAAARRDVQALVITVPTTTDQPFGDARRTDIFGALSTEWGSRLRVGAPLRRYVDPTPEVTANLGRCILQTTMSLGEAPITLGPTSHVPAPPFWLFVDGELMLAESKSPSDADGNTTVQIHRSGAGQDWGATAVPHEKGAPVLCVRIPGIYVHAKLMIVDDVFLSVGSSNLNRRGHFHDGEINAFTVPQHLRLDPENPARLLRCRLWAEHFGLSPELGLSLFADPMAALSYFDRSWFSGSRWQPLGTVGAPPLTVAIGAGAGIGSELLKIGIGTAMALLEDTLWKGVVDPTTPQDPNAMVAGPHFP